jgi:hypothetical protein
MLRYFFSLALPGKANLNKGLIVWLDGDRLSPKIHLQLASMQKKLENLQGISTPTWWIQQKNS